MALAQLPAGKRPPEAMAKRPPEAIAVSLIAVMYYEL
jgi:hypothetical protein